jgi:hypothetical protein
MTLSPGVCQKSMSISTLGPETFTMDPGIYDMHGGGFRLTGSANLVGNEVMIYNAPNGTGELVTITGPRSVTLSPRASGVYKEHVYPGTGPRRRRWW